MDQQHFVLFFSFTAWKEYVRQRRRNVVYFLILPTLKQHQTHFVFLSPMHSALIKGFAAPLRAELRAVYNVHSEKNGQKKKKKSKLQMDLNGST